MTEKPIFSLAALGWGAPFAAAFAPFSAEGLVSARVVGQQGSYQVATGEAELSAEPTGRLKREPGGLPAVGDWVALEPPSSDRSARIRAVLPRRSRFSRKVAGSRAAEQVVAANLDTILLVSGLDGDWNPRRIERYLAAAWTSGANPVVVLNKADRAEDPEALELATAEVALGVPVHRVSARTGEGVEALAVYFPAGATVGLLGSSGVGKSTLVNRILGGEVQRTGEVRQGDDRGRHTTTRRELFPTPWGGLVLDTPGMRELQLWDAGEGVEAAFADVETLAQGCRFRDCRHQGEPGCAVGAAVTDGTLDPERFASYQKLEREVEQLRARTDVQAREREKQRIKALCKAADRFRPRG
ncbi:MAG TPA: ribosome small subunit-dependent GTPase A [Thermoanaerobaculia bacterium]|jgi:ribosome biogenesis GTPase|nr:ribosome small subunit-dependent GTPase A [Thermoanaerobaculia bacterium]